MTENYNVQSFQFHKGTIKTFMLYILKYVKYYFNSIKVRLKQKFHEGLPIHTKHFNSIKVRLKL